MFKKTYTLQNVARKETEFRFGSVSCYYENNKSHFFTEIVKNWIFPSSRRSTIRWRRPPRIGIQSTSRRWGTRRPPWPTWYITHAAPTQSWWVAGGQSSSISTFVRCCLCAWTYPVKGVDDGGRGDAPPECILANHFLHPSKFTAVLRKWTKCFNHYFLLQRGSI